MREGNIPRTTKLSGLCGVLEFTTRNGHMALTNGHECLTINNGVFAMPGMFDGIVSDIQVKVAGRIFTLPMANTAIYMGGYIATKTRGPYYPRVSVRMYNAKKLSRFNWPDFEFSTNQDAAQMRIYAHQHLLYCVTQDIIQINTQTGAIFQYAGRDSDLYHPGVNCPWVGASDIYITSGEILVIDDQSCVWRIQQH